MTNHLIAVRVRRINYTLSDNITSTHNCESAKRLLDDESAKCTRDNESVKCTLDGESPNSASYISGHMLTHVGKPTVYVVHH